MKQALNSADSSYSPRPAEPPASDAAPEIGAGNAPGRDRFEGVLDAIAGVVVLGLLVVLGAQASAARFFTDECFHAHLARWIAAHGVLPRSIPELYSGFAYSYPPLFHLLGAGVVRVLGVPALPWLNLALTGTTLAVLAFALPRETPRAARRWAVLLCAGNAALATYALRFYAEALTALLATVAVILLLRLRASGSWRSALGLGVTLGLALTAKTSAIALFLFPILAASLWAAQGQRRLAGRAAVAALIGLAVALPMLIRNHVLFGSPLYPAFAPDLNPELYVLHLERFGLSAAEFYRRAGAAMGPMLIGVALAGLLASIGLRRNGVAVGLVAIGIALAIAAPAFPVHDVRHVLPLIPVLALGGGTLLAASLAPRARRFVDFGLILAAIVTLASLPGLRARLDPPKALEPAYGAVATHVPAGGTVLSLWTYDTFYHSGRAATWPVAWGQTSPPLEMFTTSDPDRFLAALDRHRIDAVLMPLRPTGERFDGANYPRSFVGCVSALVDAGRLTVAWQSRDLALVRRGEARGR